MSIFQANLRAAAYRHLLAGEKLLGGHRNDVAGYLFGWAAECALKKMMQNSGMKPLTEAQRRADPFYAHFQTLKLLLRDTASGLLATKLRTYAEDASFMQFWDISMRYSDGKAIQQAWVDRWHQDAKHVLGAMDG
jgi:hypothetical protein